MASSQSIDLALGADERVTSALARKVASQVTFYDLEQMYYANETEEEWLDYLSQ